MSPIPGHNDPLSDAQNLQAYINTNRGETEIVLTGLFNFGGDWIRDPDWILDPEDPGPPVGRVTDRQTVVIPRGMTIRGPSMREQLAPATIIGGGAKIPCDSLEFGTVNVDSGAFKVMNLGPTRGGNDRPVVIKNLAFRGWKGEAIFAEACRGLKVTNCTFTKPVPSDRLPEFNDSTSVTAIFAVGVGCIGEFVANDNVCDLREYGTHTVPYQDKNGNWRLRQVTYPLADDEQFAACVVSKFDKIAMNKNVVRGYDEGLEVVFNNLHNDPNLASQICLNYNFIRLAQHPRIASSVPGEPGAPWPGSTGIVLGNNPGSNAEVVGNVIITTGSGGVAFVLSGEYDKNLNRHLIVKNNESHQEAQDPSNRHLAGMMLGSNYPVPFPNPYPEILGPLSGAEISNNHFSGMAQFGIVTFDVRDLQISLPNYATGDPPPLTSHDNEVWDNSLLFFECEQELLLTSATQGNIITGCFHPPYGNATANTVNGSNCPPLGNERLRLTVEMVRALSQRAGG